MGSFSFRNSCALRWCTWRWSSRSRASRYLSPAPFPLPSDGEAPSGGSACPQARDAEPQGQRSGSRCVGFSSQLLEDRGCSKKERSYGRWEKNGERRGSRSHSFSCAGARAALATRLKKGIWAAARVMDPAGKCARPRGKWSLNATLGKAAGYRVTATTKRGVTADSESVLVWVWHFG